MSILVTGGAGYIGSHVVLGLLEAGEEVVVLDNLCTGFAAAVPQAATLIKGDVGDAELVNRVLQERKIDAVMHFAASTVVPESVVDPFKFYFNNSVNSSVLIKACAEAGIKRFVFSSTAAVYGSGDGTPVSEDHPLNPESPYASSKLMTEWVLRDAAIAYDFNYIVLRYFNVAGADPAGRAGQSTLNATHLIKVASQVVIGERPHLDIYGDDYPTPDGTCVRDYIHVSDLADAHLTALTHLRQTKKNDTFNCGYGSGYSVKQVVKAIEQEFGKPLPVKIVPRRLGDPVSIVADSTRLREQLHWTPKHDDLAFIVRTAAAWEKSNLHLAAG